VIALLLPAALVLGALPASAERRYRVELAGERVGFATLRIACGPEHCTASWRTSLRAPADAGGAVLERRIEIEALPGGAALRVQAFQDDGRGQREVEDGAGPAPASLAETLLSATPVGAPRCIEVREEATGRSGKACARRDGEWLELEVLGVRERIRARPGEPPDEVLLPGQRVRFLADAEAALPAQAPRLFGTEVAGGAGRATAARFCGRAAEPAQPPAPAGIPRDFPEGQSCREKTTRYLAGAEKRGLSGRHVVGVAWDGAAFVWHEWAELWVAGRWVAVDPSFRQVPAEGPRFAVARFAGGDSAAQAEAGQAVLACWGSARVEP